MTSTVTNTQNISVEVWIWHQLVGY